MLRTLFSPRLVVLHLTVVAVLVSFGWLGNWQLGVFEDSGRPRAATDPAAVPAATLTKVGERIGADAASRRVTAEGVFDAERQLLVADRTPDADVPGGRLARGKGYWTLTALRLPDGTALPVVRGWAATAEGAAVAVPEGRVTVEGRLLPSEATGSVVRGGGALPAGQVLTVSTAELINLWRGMPLRDGFLVAATPEPTGVLRAVAAGPPTVPGGFTWRNLAYAAQWWIFALFAVFMWFHFVRDALRAARRPATPAGEDGEADDAEDAGGADSGAGGESADSREPAPELERPAETERSRRAGRAVTVAGERAEASRAQEA
jgi:cytochrome oxidase assembly protein ShyY1